MNLKKIIKRLALVSMLLGVYVAAYAQGDMKETTPQPQTVEELFNACSKTGGTDSNMVFDAASIFYYDHASKKDPEILAQGRHHYLTVFFHAPGYQRQFIASGLKIYRHLADHAESEVLKSEYTDTLLLIYDKLIDCYDKDWYYYGRKGYDMMKYAPDEHESIRQSFEKAIELGGNSTEYFVLYPFMRLTGKEYTDGNISKEEVFEKYEAVVAIVEHNMEKDYLPEQYEQTLESIQSELKKIGVLDCESMKELFSEKLKESPDDSALIQKAYSTIKSFGKSCSVCDTAFVRYWKSLFEMQPELSLARELAQCEMEYGNASTALKYFDEAIELETDSAKKADLAYKAGQLLYGAKNYPKARDYARKALRYRPDWGKPYILIGRLYASSGPLCGKGTGWNSQIVVWPAIDKWEKAKQVDPSVRKEANGLIKEFSQYMPSMEQIFNRSMDEGDPFEVGCWINEKTTVRVKPK